jgi:hypothetical protein
VSPILASLILAVIWGEPYQFLIYPALWILWDFPDYLYLLGSSSQSTCLCTEWLVGSLPVWSPIPESGSICECNFLNCWRPPSSGRWYSRGHLLSSGTVSDFPALCHVTGQPRDLRQNIYFLLTHTAEASVLPILYMGTLGEIFKPCGEYTQGRNLLFPSPRRAGQEELG